LQVKSSKLKGKKMELQNFMLCDDIRQEVGNKISLMGIFDEIIELNRMPQMPEKDPITIRLSVCARIIFVQEDKNRGISRLRVRMSQDNGAGQVVGEGELVLAGDNKMMKMNFITSFPATFAQDCAIAVEFDFINGKGEVVENLRSTPYKIVMRKAQ
jgi:hypothetical protein